MVAVLSLSGYGAARPGAVVVLSSHLRNGPVRVERPGAPDLDEGQLAALRAWVQAGGHLVLFGHAARLVVDLQFESERPTCRAFRWGYDPRALAGRA